MPILIPSATQAALRRSLAKHSSTLAADLLQQVGARLQSGLESILNPQQVLREGAEQTVTVGENPASVRGAIAELLREFETPEAVRESLNLDFKLQVAEEVSRGAGRYVAENDPAFVEEMPGWELLRVYDRDVPRGFRRMGKTLIEVPDEDWPTRWTAAAQAAGDDAALRVLNETGRMIALKSSGIWQALGDGAGGFDDVLGNPYPPFAFNSGMDCDQVSREDCEALGLLQPGQTPQPARFDPEQLFAPLE